MGRRGAQLLKEMRGLGRVRAVGILRPRRFPGKFPETVFPRRSQISKGISGNLAPGQAAAVVGVTKPCLPGAIVLLEGITMYHILLWTIAARRDCGGPPQTIASCVNFTATLIAVNRP